MNKKDYIALIQHPEHATQQQLQELERMVSIFPYCQSAHLLIARLAHDQKTMLADQKLKLAAAYASDRSQLRSFVTATEYTVQEITTNIPLVVIDQQEATEEDTTIHSEEATVVSQVPAASPIATESSTESHTSVVQPRTTAKDPALAEMISHREKLMEELERKLEEIRRNREQFQSKVASTEKTSEPNASDANNLSTKGSAKQNAEAIETTPVSKPAPVIEIPESPFEFNIGTVTAAKEETESIHPIESILSSAQRNTALTPPVTNEELPDAVKAIYSEINPIEASTSAHVLDEILRMDEKQQLEAEDLSVFRKKKKTESAPAEVPLPPPLPPLQETESGVIYTHEDAPVTREESLVPFTILGKMEGYIASDNDTENNSVDQEQADLLGSYLDFMQLKKLKNKRDPRKVDAIIDRFIKDEPIISRLMPGQGEEQTEDLAEKSYIPPAGLISENFAKILLSQGKKDRAIRVYEELSLKNPEKKDYFASLIDKIRKGESLL